MNKLEKDIKDRFINAQSLEGIDKDDLWTSISEARLGQNDTRKKRRAIFFFWSIIGALGIFSSIAVYHNMGTISEDYTSLLETTNESSAESSEQKKTVLSPVSERSTLEMEVEVKESVKPEESYVKQEETPEILVVIEDVKEGKKKKNEIAETVNPTQLLQNEIIEDRLSKTNFDVERNRLSEYLTLNPIKDRSHPLEEASILLKDGNNVLLPETGGSLEMLPLKVEYLNEEIHTAFPISEIIRKQNRNRLPFKVYAGTNLLRDKYSEKRESLGLIDSLNSSLTLEPGVSIGAAVRLKKWQNWSLNVGVEYHKFNQRFDKVFVTDTLVLAGENGQTLFNAVNVRTIRHYNSLQIVTIPIEFEISKKFQRVEPGIGLGASYSFVIDQSGRKLINEEQVSAFSNGRKQYANYISLRVTPFIGYRLSERMILNVNASMSYQGHSKSDFIDINNNSLTIVPSVGVSFNY